MSSIRKFQTKNDYPTFIDLLNSATDKAIHTETAQREFAASIGISPEQDRIIAMHPDDDSRLIAYCDIWRMYSTASVEMMLLVHPDWRRQGLGSRLLEAGLNHAEQLTATAIDAYAEPDDDVVKGFLEHHNFSLSGYELICSGLIVETVMSCCENCYVMLCSHLLSTEVILCTSVLLRGRVLRVYDV